MPPDDAFASLWVDRAYLDEEEVGGEQEQMGSLPYGSLPWVGNPFDELMPNVHQEQRHHSSPPIQQQQ
ncbi:hypothetical protein KSS87_009732 [Heliosperma pusillum]|nr:hypothetical protein KSS87_008266 [Heliosperma pusillum]KAH9618659.1 hypothetical protein KSS87_009732 [Heliosperma pusillum]